MTCLGGFLLSALSKAQAWLNTICSKASSSTVKRNISFHPHPTFDSVVPMMTSTIATE